MKTKITTTLLLFLFIQIGFGQNLTGIEQKASNFSTALTSGNFSDAIIDFSEAVATQIDAEKLAEIWDQLEAQAGKFIKLDRIRSEEQDGIPITIQPVHFKNSILDLKLAFDPSETIISILFVPHQPVVLDLVETDNFYEEVIIVNTGKNLTLRGILTLPKNKENVPAVILVHGSGPNDMDETLGGNKLFKDLAHGLAERGIAVLRYDKRTYAYAGKPELNTNTLTLHEETIEDAISAVDFARKHKVIDKKNVFVLGHSLGGMSAPQIAERSKHTKGIIIMAGNARPLERLVLEQFNYLFNEDGIITAEENTAIENYKSQLMNLEALKKDPNATGTLPLGMSANYWKYLVAYNQVETAKNLNKPILVLQGERDYQVTMEDYQIWKNAIGDQADVVFHSYSKLNHMMREGSGACYPSEYQIKSNLPDYLVRDIALWILPGI